MVKCLIDQGADQIVIKNKSIDNARDLQHFAHNLGFKNIELFNSDFSNFNVFQNSHSSKPLIYKITGAWGNHEGSILLWVCMISIYGFLYSLFSKSLDNFKILVLKIQSALFIIFCFFIIFTSNPFLVNSVVVEEGLGLNPILQDPALAIHPPMLLSLIHI